ncbi:hypothetical protein INR49_004440 [Caranx melampygus]|nr:hypothetical protein INR49_004440 [Caranx melampygus]
MQEWQGSQGTVQLPDLSPTRMMTEPEPGVKERVTGFSLQILAAQYSSSNYIRQLETKVRILEDDNNKLLSQAYSRYSLSQIQTKKSGLLGERIAIRSTLVSRRHHHYAS